MSTICNRPPITILGVDPGLQVTGYAVLDSRERLPVVLEAGIVKTTEGSAAADMAQRLRSLYQERMEVLCSTLHTLLPAAEFIEPDGGFFLSITLAEGTTNEALRAQAAALQLNLSDGRGFFPIPADGERFLRLPFCALQPDELREGVRRLARAVEQTAPGSVATT